MIIQAEYEANEAKHIKENIPANLDETIKSIYNVSKAM